ncbi:Ig domain protein group 2 domain protein [Gemmatirosa kalamazoonensis]|uniref:Ig domain protein group 2 domain protein n=1 Tax=Gemmatirosa kalamazoonensis TaxID=861299 RepID=W0RLB9_9BACT|nr:Ig-like domain-containing protein [Gemmatirosa kalamazoonensis]AHG91227.1 Ig domain protein group 2 domain protein [Gemmatirosa kalamazoonensis]
MIAPWRWNRRRADARVDTLPSLATLVACGIAAGCGHRGGTDPGDPVAVSVSIAVPMRTLHVGDTLRANAAAFDSTGHTLQGVATRWESSDPRVASVSSSGLVLGLAPGTTTITATVGTARGTVEVQVLRPLAFTVSVLPESTAVAASVIVDFTATARDVAGQPIAGVRPEWLSTAPDVATVDGDGRVTALAPGRAEILATVDAVAGRGIVVVTRPSSVHVTSVAPAVLVPGATVTIAGSGFSANRTSNTVTIGGVVATVRTASATQLTATVASTGYGCVPTRDVPVTVTVAGESGSLAASLQVAQRRTLPEGQAIVLSDPAQSACNELAPATGRYVVAVFDPSTSSTAVPFALRGAPSVAPPPVDPAAASERLASVAAAHAVRATSAALPDARIAALGDTVTLHVLTAGARGCGDPAVDVRARTVVVGQRVTVLEDVAAPLAGTMDDDYRAIAQEYDDVTFPLVESTFGNPLAVDARLGRTGRIALLFTPEVNARGVLGMSFNCDLLPSSTARASNEQQIVYLAVPTSSAPGFGDGRFTGTRAAWRRRIRAIAAHETKHVASYAERLARSAPFEEPWVEEGSALVAEELFARAVRALPTRRETGYAESLECELRPTLGGCDLIPVAFSDAFARLHAMLVDPAALTPVVTDPALDPGGAFYGGAWWLLRWAADHAGPTDPPFFRALVAGPQTGADNVAARVGRPWPDLLGEWWLATALDDRPGFVPQRATLGEPSWRLRDVLAGASATGDPRFPRAFPLQPRALSFGDFVVDVPNGVRGGGAVFFELSGPTVARQLLEVRSLTPGAAAPPLGIAIARVP